MIKEDHNYRGDYGYEEQLENLKNKIWGIENA